MAVILNEFIAKTKALASKVNENFALLQEDLASMGTFLEQKMTILKEELLNDIQVTSETKANKDLSNVDSTGLSKITSSIAPNYTASYSVSSGWVATSDGWLSIDGNSSANGTSYLYIDGIEVYKNYQQAGDGRAGTLNITSCCFIGKGQTITTTGQIATIKFIPCKGN